METKTEVEVRLTAEDVNKAVRDFCTTKSDEWHFGDAQIEWLASGGCTLRLTTVETDKPDGDPD